MEDYWEYRLDITNVSIKEVVKACATNPLYQNTHIEREGNKVYLVRSKNDCV